VKSGWDGVLLGNENTVSKSGLRAPPLSLPLPMGKPVVALSGAEASQLIDTLKRIRTGEVDLDSILQDAAP
jgi:hypothetical protein